MVSWRNVSLAGNFEAGQCALRNVSEKMIVLERFLLVTQIYVWFTRASQFKQIHCVVFHIYHNYVWPEICHTDFRGIDPPPAA